MTGFRKSQCVQRYARLTEHLAHCIAPVLQVAVRSPCSNDEIGALCCAEDRVVVLWADGVCRGSKPDGVGGSKRKDVCRHD